jgi:hypothetical protein
MRTIVRRDLRDEDPADYRWTDEELDRHIGRAVREYSEAAPDEQSTVRATTAGSRTIDISDLTGLVMVEAVEYPAGEFPPGEFRPRYQRFALWGDALTLLCDEVPDGSDVCIYYGRLHTLDAAGSTVPPKHEDLIAAGAAGYAATAWAAYAINRITAGGTQPAAGFLAWGRERLGYFRSELRRLGRRGRVRVRSLYRPFHGSASKATDTGA